MNYLHTSALLVVAYLAVFFAACQNAFRSFLGTNLDVLPPLMVYCGLSMEWAPLTLVAVLGALWLDTLSANPLGATILPLFLIGYAVRCRREMILRDQRFAQFVLGAAASLAAPMLSLLLLLATGHQPLVGWGSLRQCGLMALLGGAITPVLFWLFDRFKLAFSYPRLPEAPFRLDREIKRGRD